MEVTAGEIVFDMLKRFGADGLINESRECGCALEEMSPDGCMNEFCKVARFKRMDSDDEREDDELDGQ